MRRLRWRRRLTKNAKTMKKILIHIVPVLLSFIWLMANHHTFDPISLKGPYFLRFYLLLVFGFYISIFVLKLFNEKISKTTFYFMILIFTFGILKLIRGILLGKPVGFLIMLLLSEVIVILIINLYKLNDKLK
jgi:hypothetical protein